MAVWQVIKWAFLLYLLSIVLRWVIDAIAKENPRPGGQTHKKAGGTIPLPGSWEVKPTYESGPPYYVYEEKGITQIAYRGSDDYAAIAGEIARATGRTKRIG